MSGIAASFAMGAQNPVLKGGSASYLTPTSGAGAVISVTRAGTLSLLFNSNPTPVDFAGQWGGPVPFSTMGDAYEVRLTNLSGGLSFGDPEFQLANTWYALTSSRQFKSFALSGNGQFDNSHKLEIRRASTQQILATGTFFVSVNNFG